MTVVNMNARDRKALKPMSADDVLTDAQKAAIKAEREESWYRREHERLGEKIEACRRSLAERLREAADEAEKPEGDPLYKLDGRSLIDLAARIRVWSRLRFLKAEEATFTQWRKDAADYATREVMNKINDSQSTSILANHVEAVELKLYRDFTQGWTF